MTIPPPDARQLAALALIGLTEEEEPALQQQLEEILAAAQELVQLDTGGVEPTIGVVPLCDVMRDDVPHESLTQERALANAPERAQGQFRVPKVVAEA